MQIQRKMLISVAISVGISYGMMYACYHFLYLHSGALAVALIFGMQVYTVLTLKEHKLAL